MNPDSIIEISRAAMWTTLLIGGPFMAVAMIVGLTISVLQAATQINEMTLSFVPKVIAVGFTLWVGGAWMVEKWIAFTVEIFSSIGGGGL